MKTNKKNKIAIISAIVVVLIALIGYLVYKNRDALSNMTDKMLIKNAYGEKVKVDGKNMVVQKYGNNPDKRVVLLPGLGYVSPILDFKPLAELLANNYEVLVVEQFGYGLSDAPVTDRTIENITSELHSLLEKMNYKKYTLMGHSMSGIYSLYYVNTYKDEVEAFIGIDISTPDMNDGFDATAMEIEYANEQKAKITSGEVRRETKDDASSLLPTYKDYTYNDKDTKLYRRMYLVNKYNDAFFNEVNRTVENCNKTKGMTFGDIPVLMFTSSVNDQFLPGWHDMHIKLVGNEKNSEVIQLEGSHYLHYTHRTEIVSTMNAFYEKNVR